MLNGIKKLFGLENIDYAQLVKNGATILDVRTKKEFSGGHIKGAMNIPVDELSNNIHKLSDKHKPIITCCASGMRSGMAKGILKSKGYAEVYNGGAWQSLEGKISSSAR